MGVSSVHRLLKLLRSSCFVVSVALGYATENKPHADVREVNHSPDARRRIIGTKNSSIASGE